MENANVVEETIKRVALHPGVVGVLVINSDGVPIRSTLDNALSVQYAGLISHLTMKARSLIKTLDRLDHSTDELQCVRIRSAKHEIVVAPEYEKGQEYTLIVVQEPLGK